MERFKGTKGKWGVSKQCENHVVSRYFICDTSSYFLGKEEENANAKLIATSPDLLKNAISTVETLKLILENPENKLNTKATILIELCLMNNQRVINEALGIESNKS